MLHGVRDLTYDPQGYIYWKGNCVEHYNDPTSPDMIEPARELERRCTILERRGVEINTKSVIWEWDESGNEDRWEIAFHDCDASEVAQRISKRLCMAYGINGICDPAYIASVIDSEITLTGCADCPVLKQGGDHHG